MATVKTDAEWQKRLGDTFTANGLIGGSLVSVQNAEDAVGQHLVNTFKGQNVLLDSFQGFFIDTLTIAMDKIRTDGWPKDRLNYPVALVSFCNLFRRCRACEVLYLKGYPLDAYALMRDIKDRTFMLSGVAHNMITFSALIGAPTAQITDEAEYKKQTTRNRKDAEHRVANGLMGKTSGLDAKDRENLKRWDDYFHYEVHGGHVSLIQELRAVSQGHLPQIGPAVDRDAFIMYMNRSAELGWIITRLLPFLQSSKDSFGTRWKEKHGILEDSFRYMLEGFSNLGKELGPSFIRMMDAKFTFKEPFFYFEADGSST